MSYQMTIHLTDQEYAALAAEAEKTRTFLGSSSLPPTLVCADLSLIETAIAEGLNAEDPNNYL